MTRSSAAIGFGRNHVSDWLYITREQTMSKRTPHCSACGQSAAGPISGHARREGMEAERIGVVCD
jgi:hypothetical protein